MKALILISIIIFHQIRASSQEQIIKWHDHVKLEWSDFEGKADMKSPFAAMSAVGIQYKYNSWSNGKIYKINFEIHSTFDRTKSWSKRRLRTPGMLKHEQLHFDLAALVGREFSKEASSRSYSKNYKSEIVEMFNRYSKTLQKLQQKYDEQTLHSENKVRQKEWENLVYKELLL